ncbi:hypothetical protein [Streptomyces sp. NBC_00299]|nr:hypothetical protein [Streptomyces sp. NBC_00299]
MKLMGIKTVTVYSTVDDEAEGHLLAHVHQEQARERPKTSAHSCRG